MNQRERKNWDDDTKVMPVVPQDEQTNYQVLALSMVKSHVLDCMVLGGNRTPPDFDVYIVWFCKTLQNWKALVCTTLLDNMYYEVIYNGDLRETYIDTYEKVDNFKILD